MTVEYDGVLWTKAKSGYYQASIKIQGQKNWLHQHVYENERGTIHKGLEVHHINRNKDDNSIENLELVDSKAHHRKHASYKHSDPERYRKQVEHLNRIRPPSGWSKDPAKRKEHREAIRRAMASVLPVERVCGHCGKKFMAKPFGKHVYCSNACKAAHRRSIGADSVNRICSVCGDDFSVNRYRKTETCGRSCANVIRARTIKNAID